MYQIIRKKFPQDPDFPSRYYDLMIYKKILNGEIYDCFDYQYHNEFVSSCYVQEEHRAPSINYGVNILRTVVEESVSFLFGEDRFPSFLLDDESTKEFITKAIKDTRMVEHFQDAATRGSIGSAAIFLKVSAQRFFLEVFDTIFLTPKYDRDEPDKLVSVTERRKVLGSDLVDLGYAIPKEKLKLLWWYHRVWDRNEELAYYPYTLDDGLRMREGKFSPTRDPNNSVVHNLGFVPWVWIRNLVGSGSKIDGRCTFEPGIEGAVAIDYALSRADRSLRYSADPMTVFKTRTPEELGQAINRDSSNAIILDVEGDAKLLEISGNASAAILEHVQEMRNGVMEAIHGSRADPDKLATSNSSVAQRLLYSPMVRLASHLRVQYGDNGILPLLEMMIDIASKRQNTSKPILLLKKPAPKVDPSMEINLTWTDYFPPTPFDLQLEAQAWQLLVESGIFSKSTARENARSYIDFGDEEDEADRVKSEQDDDQDREIETETALIKAKPAPAKSSVKRPVSKTKTVTRS